MCRNREAVSAGRVLSSGHQTNELQVVRWLITNYVSRFRRAVQSPLLALLPVLTQLAQGQDQGGKDFVVPA
jgi:hypothetical protein